MNNKIFINFIMKKIYFKIKNKKLLVENKIKTTWNFKNITNKLYFKFWITLKNIKYLKL